MPLRLKSTAIWVALFYFGSGCPGKYGLKCFVYLNEILGNISEICTIEYVYDRRENRVIIELLH